MGIGRLSTLIFFCFFLASVSVFANVIWEDSFENGFSGWRGHTDVFEVVNIQSRTGNYALLNRGVVNAAVTHNVGNAYEIAYECSFYDFGDQISETLCSVSNKERPDSGSSLLIGIETVKSKEFYTYFLSPDVQSWGVTSVPRSKGWHTAVFYKNNGKTQLFLDTVRITETTKINNWEYVGVWLNGWNTQGHGFALYDDFRVSQGIQDIQTILNPSMQRISSAKETYNLINENNQTESADKQSFTKDESSIQAPIKQDTDETAVKSELIIEKKSKFSKYLLIILFLVMGFFLVKYFFKEKSKYALVSAENRKKYAELIEKEKELREEEEEVRKNREEAKTELQHASLTRQEYEKLLKREKELLVKEEEAIKEREVIEEKRKKLERVKELEKQRAEMNEMLIKSENIRTYNSFKKKLNLNKDQHNIPDAVKQYKLAFGTSKHELPYLVKYIAEDVLGSDNVEFVEREITRTFAKRETILPDSFLTDMQQIDNMSGREFEDFLEKVFMNLKYTVKRKKQTRDGGVDLILENDEGITVVQAKRYKITTPVPINAVQAVASNRRTYNAKRVIVVTTSSKFTVDAQKLAESEGVELINRTGLKDLIRRAKLIKNG